MHENDYSLIVEHDRCGLLQGCATECLQKLGLSAPVVFFHPLTLLFKGYMHRC